MKLGLLLSWKSAPPTIALVLTLGYAAQTGGKRPRSSMSPTVVLDKAGNLILALGSPGGRYIIGNIIAGILSTIDAGMPLQAAINASKVWVS